MLSPDYIAGFFDGEGTIVMGVHTQPQTTIGYQFVTHIGIVQQKAEVLHEIQRTMGGYGHMVRNEANNTWVWQIQRREDIRSFLLAMKGRLFIKQRQAEIMLEACSLLGTMGRGMFKGSKHGQPKIPKASLLRLVELVELNRSLNLQYHRGNHTDTTEVRKAILQRFDV
jgi:hypothetical protein